MTMKKNSNFNKLSNKEKMFFVHVDKFVKTKIVEEIKEKTNQNLNNSTTQTTKKSENTNKP